MPAKYCGTCGGEFGKDISAEDQHKCTSATAKEPEWCEVCGAELTAFGACLNDHDEEEETNG